MKHNQWYVGYGSTVEEIDAEIRRRQRMAILMQPKKEKRVSQERTMADEEWLNKRREERRNRR